MKNDGLDEDKIVAEGRATRAKIFAEYDYDIRKVAERARNIQLPSGMKRITSPAELQQEIQGAPPSDVFEQA